MMVAGGNEEKYSITKREYLGSKVYVGLNTATEAKEVTFAVDFEPGTVLVDQYSGAKYTVNGKKKVTVKLASRDAGGTFILARSTKMGRPEKAGKPGKSGK